MLCRDNAARMEGGWKEVTPPAWQTAIRHVEHGDYGDHQEWTPRFRLQLQLVPSQLAPRPTQALQLAQAVHSVRGCDPASVLCTQPCPPRGVPAI